MSIRKIERSIDLPDRQRIVWHNPGSFTKNPDVIRFDDGRMLFVYNDSNQHFPTEYSRITLIESIDGGETWGNPLMLDESFPIKGEERWVTPRISLLSDGRVAVLCDTDDFHHCHENQPVGTWIWWSCDEGRTWTDKKLTEIPGIEPDRIIEMPDGELVVCAHYMFKATRRLGMFMMKSTDGGETWGNYNVIASDKVHNYCEGNLFRLNSGRWVCIMRDNVHNNYPCYLSFSDDSGNTWSKPIAAPFSGDRPFGRQLSDGRTLVTYRNQAGTPGLYAWLGDIESESGYKISKTLFTISHSTGIQDVDALQARGLDVGGAVALTDDALILSSVKGRKCRYMLYPPENFFSDMCFEAEIKIEGDDDDTAFELQIARIQAHVWIKADGIYAGPDAAIDLISRQDMRKWHKIRCQFVDGLSEVYIDGINIIRGQQHNWDAPMFRSFFGSGSKAAKAYIRSIRYELKNPTDDDINFYWDIKMGCYPDQYANDRWLQVDFNNNAFPDHGYSTWLECGDGEILLLDYSNKDAETGKANIKAYKLLLSDFDS